MIPYEIIEKKQAGTALDPEEINFFLRGYTTGDIPDYQMSALLMAIYFQGLNTGETRNFIDQYLESGTRLDLTDIAGYKVDKHSTGGVGDKVSLILAPLVASAGLTVPMISGRGLGHTGGTLDKLESIPGLTVDYTAEEFKQQIADIGLCIMSQSDAIVPADKKLYALRDVTATIRSIPLICASIMSKKIAEGIDGLVLDVKTGAGAFMAEYHQSRLLAEKLVAIGQEFGLDTVAVITDMNQPLGNAVGNWLEVRESIECLKGTGPADVIEVTLTLGGWMLVLGGHVETVDAGKRELQKQIKTGAALEKFYEFVEIQQGDLSVVKNPGRYPESKYPRDVLASGTGVVQSIDARKIGMAGVQLGAGRMQMTDTLDPRAGILLRKKIGDEVAEGEILARILTDHEHSLEPIARKVMNAFAIGPEPVDPPTLVHEVVR